MIVITDLEFSTIAYINNQCYYAKFQLSMTNRLLMKKIPKFPKFIEKM